MKDLVTVLVTTWLCLFFVVGLEFYSWVGISNFRTVLDQQAEDIAELKTQLSAKTPEKIKFYTIPGYKCDTSIIAGYCSNMYPVTQAECDKKNSHLFKVTE